MLNESEDIGRSHFECTRNCHKSSILGNCVFIGDVKLLRTYSGLNNKAQDYLFGYLYAILFATTNHDSHRITINVSNLSRA